MMKNPDSFKLYDEMFLLKHYNDSGENDYTFTIFEYGGTNSYGGMTTSEAVFKDDEYIMDYSEGPDEDDSNYIEQIKTQFAIEHYMLTGEGESWKKIDINIEKIKNKMKLE